MRNGTWNVAYAYRPRLEALRQTLARHAADIWILTATRDDLVPDGAGHVAYSADRPRNRSGIRPGSRWVSIWSRLVIIRQVETHDPKRTVGAVFDTPRGERLVYGNVLAWHAGKGDHPAETTVPDWSERHREIPLQAAEWANLKVRESVAQLCMAGRTACPCPCWSERIHSN